MGAAVFLCRRDRLENAKTCRLNYQPRDPKANLYTGNLAILPDSRRIIQIGEYRVNSENRRNW
jgi:hypothetical protein